MRSRLRCREAHARTAPSGGRIGPRNGRGPRRHDSPKTPSRSAPDRKSVFGSLSRLAARRAGRRSLGRRPKSGCRGLPLRPSSRPRRPSPGRWRSCRRSSGHPCGRLRMPARDPRRSCRSHHDAQTYPDCHLIGSRHQLLYYPHTSKPHISSTVPTLIPKNVEHTQTLNTSIGTNIDQSTMLYYSP